MKRKIRFEMLNEKKNFLKKKVKVLIDWYWSLFANEEKSCCWMIVNKSLNNEMNFDE
jgi:hypothetical protein